MENKNQTHYDDGLHHQENGYSEMFKRSREGKNNILLLLLRECHSCPPLLAIREIEFQTVQGLNKEKLCPIGKEEMPTQRLQQSCSCTDTQAEGAAGVSG